MNHVPEKYHKAIMEEYVECLKYKRDFSVYYEFITRQGDILYIHATAKNGGIYWFGVLDVDSFNHKPIPRAYR
jgi:hypothetical protein